MLTKKDKLLAAAQKFLERGSLDKALVEFQRAAQEDAKDTRTWLRIAEIHVKHGDTNQATQVYLRTAGLYVEQGFFQRAAAVYKNVLKLTPGHTEAHVKLAEVYRQLGLLSDSSQQFELAAAALVKAGKPKEAIAALAQILEMNPDQVPVRVKMGEIAAQAGMTEEAIEEFNRAAAQMESLGRTDDFLRVAERILQLQPDNTTLGKKAAVRYMERQNPKAALAKLQACFNTDNKDAETLQLLANAFSELGQSAKTLTVLKELAKIQEDQRQYGERAATLQRIHAIDPSDPLVADLNLVKPKRRFEGENPDTPAPLPSAERRPVRRQPSITFSELAVPPILMREPSEPYLSAAETALPTLDDEQVAAEVERLLAETDTFVKYGLVERAAEHIRKVFDVAPEHDLAQERLIAILIQLGRTAEAVEELGILADRRSDSDPAAAVRHLEHALSLDPGAVGARHMLQRLTEKHPSAPRIELDDPEVLELDELDHMDEQHLDEIHDLDLEPEVSQDADENAEEDAGVQRDPEAPAAPIMMDESIEWDAGEHTQIDPPGLRQSLGLRNGPTGSPAAAARTSPLQPTMTPAPVTPAPMTPAPVRGAPPSVRAASPSGAGRAVGTPAPAPRSMDWTPTPAPAAVARPAAPATESVLVDDLDIEFDLPQPTSAMASTAFASPLTPTPTPTPTPTAVSAPVPAAVTPALPDEIEAEIEQVDFFLEQGLPDEARAVLDEIGREFAQHPEVRARRARIEGGQFEEATRTHMPAGIEQLLMGQGTAAANAGAVPRGTVAGGSGGSPGNSGRTPVFAAVTPRATVLGGGDATTHRDLGIAYKEMGLKEAAIAEFSKLLDDPEQTVFALMMIGECHEADRAFAEALSHYKRALNRPSVRDDESTRLYFLLGRAFEALGDKGEALYFFEKVARRDARFEDVAVRVDRLRKSGVAPIDRGTEDRRRTGAADPRGSR